MPLANANNIICYYCSRQVKCQNGIGNFCEVVKSNFNLIYNIFLDVLVVLIDVIFFSLVSCNVCNKKFYYL